MKVLCVLAVLAAVLAAPAVAAPVSAYARLPAIENVTVSPDGSQLAMVVTDGERRTVAVQDNATKAFKAKADFGDVPVQRIRWADEGHLLITTAVQFDPTSVTGGLKEWRRLHIFDVTASALTTTMEDTPDHRSAVQSAPAVRIVDGKPAVFVEGIQFVDRHGYIALFQIDLATGRSRIVQPAVDGSRRWLVGRDGRAVARQMYDDRLRRWTIEVRDKAGWRVVHTATAPQEGATLVCLGRDGQSVIYSVRNASGETSWREARLDGGPETAFALPASHGPVVDPQSGQVLGHAGWDGDAYQTVYLDPADERVMQTVRDTYPAISASIDSWSNDRSKVVALIDRPGHTPGFALFDLAARRADWIGAQYPELTDADIANQTRVRFKAADGLELSGYLTRPPGRSQARNLPLIVLPHDGPRERDVPGFDWIAQAIASRGYAVLQLNFRGSGDLAPGLRQAGDGEIGRKMQTDLSDGVRALAAGGLIDPKRVCIVGQGYGGYAALAGATLDPGVYRCAVSIDGYFALRWPESGAGPGSEGAAAARRRLGVDGPDDPRLVQYSPLRQADKAGIPILLIHGKDDTVFAAKNSEEMAAALRKAGKPVDLLLLENGDRRLTRASAGVDLLNATVTFLEKYNPPN